MKFLCSVCLVLVALAWHAAAAENLYADNVIIALDTSGSMERKMADGKSRMRTAQDALLTVTSQLEADTNIGLYVFGGGGKWMYPLGPIDQKRLEQAIRKTRPNGNTPLGGALNEAANTLLAQRAKQHGYGTYRLLVVTDGEASDRAKMERVIPQVLARGVTLDAIGLDMAQDHSLATQVHSYKRADNKAALTEAIAASFAEIQEGDQASDEMFALVAGLDNDVASAAIGAYATSGNEPIDASASTSALERRISPGPTVSVNQTSNDPSGFGGILQIIFIAVFFLIILARVFRSGSRNR